MHDLKKQKQIKNNTFRCKRHIKKVKNDFVIETGLISWNITMFYRFAT